MKSLTLQEIRDYAVPEKSFALWWLGQASFLVKSPGGVVLALDPYLTNSCKAIGAEIGLNMDRQTPPPLSPQELAGIDAYVMTHSHQDHCDSETVTGYREGGGRGPYYAPGETCEKLESLGVPSEEIRMIWPNKEHTVGDVTFRATFCIPLGGDDLTHVGYLMRLADGPTIYFTGDTTYHDVISESVREHKPDAMIAVINPAFRNLSPEEAARLAKELDVRIALPCHYDLFADNCQPPHMLRTNLLIKGIGERYRELQHAVPFVFPE